jgi:type II secretory pathway pseudopilin PulG
VYSVGMSKFSDAFCGTTLPRAIRDPATIGLVISGIGAATGVISAVGAVDAGNKATDANKSMEQAQAEQEAYRRNQRNAAITEAQGFVNQVQRSEYDKMASADFSKALNDVAGAMASRGLGTSNTAALAALGGASTDLRQQYGRQFLSDRNQAQSMLQGARNAAAGDTMSKPFGYDDNPYGGVQPSVDGALKFGADFARGLPPRNSAVKKPGELGYTPSF